MNIIKKYIRYNYSKRQGAIKYIVVHDTGNKGRGANSLAHYNFFNGGDRQSSAHYFVDDKQIIEVIDPKTNRSWHCGDGKGKKGITNDNSIGVEMCVNIDGNFNETFKNTVELVKYLQKIYNISDDNVVRHFDASGKNCPRSLISDHTNNHNWAEFKQLLKQKQVLYRVCVGSYSNIDNARKKAEEVGGFIVEYIKE